MLALSIVVIVIGCAPCLSSLKDILLGIGAGGVSSILVAFFIDIADTKKAHEKQKEIFNRLTLSVDIACEELLTEFVVAAQEVYGADTNKRTFREWAEMLLKDDHAEEKVLYEAEYALQQIKEIKQRAQQLQQDIKLQLENRYFTESFEKKVEKIIHTCNRIERERKRKNYSSCLSLITKNLVTAMCDYNSTLLDKFEKPFTWTEEEQ